MWYDNEDIRDDVFIRTSVIIKRNIKGFPFESKASENDKLGICEQISSVAPTIGLKYIKISETNDEVLSYLADKDYLPLKHKNFSEFALLTGDNDSFVGINLKDHLNVVSRVSGADVKMAFMQAEELAQKLESVVDVAYSDKLGFLTSSLKNVGTGMTISFVVSIPGILKTANGFDNISNRLNQYGWEIVSLADSEKEIGEAPYRITCRNTLGYSEEEVIERAGLVADDVYKYEQACRKIIFKKRKNIIIDQYYKAYGLLRYARKLQKNEAQSAISWLRLGQNFIEDNETNLNWNKIKRINQCVTLSFGQKMHIKHREINDAEVDMLRADEIRKILTEE